VQAKLQNMQSNEVPWLLPGTKKYFQTKFLDLVNAIYRTSNMGQVFFTFS